jgi:hypothetical protein
MRIFFVALALTVAFIATGSPSAHAGGLLINSGFEDGPSGWLLNAGELGTATSPVQSGTYSGHFTGTGQPTTQFVYQWVGVRPDEDYAASGWVAASGAVTRVFLRVSWYDSRGQHLIDWDSNWLPQLDGAFYRLTTDTHLSLSAAHSARVSAVVQADSSFVIHLDDFEFLGPAAGSSTPAPPTPVPTVVTPTPDPLPVPTATPRSTPARTPTPRPTRSPSPGTATPAEEPSAFPSLVNGGFEQLRPDGTPYGWHKQGGEVSSSDLGSEGVRSLALTSQTSSTKWAYQTIAVSGGASYRGSVDARASGAAEAVFLRISWYSSSDASGPALTSDDSPEAALSGNDPLQRLTTGPIEAPPEAKSAKFRLMLRPASSQQAIGHFDAASFEATQPGRESLVRDAVGAGGGQRGRAALPAIKQATAAEQTPILSQARGRLANVKPPATPQPTIPQAVGGNGHEWAILLAVGVAVVAVAIGASHELWQRRKKSSGDEGLIGD